MKNFAFMLAGLLLVANLSPVKLQAQPQQAIYYQEAQELEAQAARAAAAHGLQSGVLQQAANVNGAAASALKSAVPVFSAAPQVLGLFNHVFGSESAGLGQAPSQLGSQYPGSQPTMTMPVSKPVFSSLSGMVNPSAGTGISGSQNALNPSGANGTSDSLSGLLDSGGAPTSPAIGAENPVGGQNSGVASPPPPSGVGTVPGGWNSGNAPYSSPGNGDALGSALAAPNSPSLPSPTPNSSPNAPTDNTGTATQDAIDQSQSLYDQAKNGFNDFLYDAKQQASDALNSILPEEAKNAMPFIEHVGHGLGINVGRVQQKDYGDGLDEDNDMLIKSGGSNP